jgi:hypothetical protein
VFTEHGALMLATFCPVRRDQASIRGSGRSFAWGAPRQSRRLNRRLNDLGALRRQFKVVFDAIRQLMESAPESPDRRIGFHPDP